MSPDAPPPDPGVAEVFTYAAVIVVFIDVAIVDVDSVATVSFMDDVVDEHVPVLSKKKRLRLHYVLRNAKKSRYFIIENFPPYFPQKQVCLFCWFPLALIRK